MRDPRAILRQVFNRNGMTLPEYQTLTAALDRLDMLNEEHVVSVKRLEARFGKLADQVSALLTKPVSPLGEALLEGVTSPAAVAAAAERPGLVPAPPRLHAAGGG